MSNDELGNQNIQVSKKEIKINNLIFSLDEENKTAEVIGNEKEKTYIIPKSIIYNNEEFLVISINEYSFKNAFIDSIEFSEDSEVQKIEKNAFKYSCITNITFPASVTDIREGWNANINRLLNVQINSNNKKYKKCDKIIIGKSDNKSDIYDILIFVSRDIKTVTIPSSIKRISSYSFSHSLIKTIVFPPSVTEIGEFAFFLCLQLNNIEFTKDSNLQKIESNAFNLSSIENLKIPAKLSELEKEWCNNTKKLTKVTVDCENQIFKNYEKDDKLIIGKSHIKSSEFDILVFASRDIKTTTIPPTIKRILPYSFSYSSIEKVIISNSVTEIDEYAFSNCLKLCKVEIPYDSQLKIINKYAFHSTNIDKIFLPKHVTKICENAFTCCYKLQNIEFSEDSNLHTIESNAFSSSMIESITIPSSVCELKDGWCNFTKNLIKVEIGSNNKYFKKYENDDKLIIGKSSNESDDFDVLMFASRDIKNTKIPPNIKLISTSSFGCSTIENIIIPPSVTKICSSAFSMCKKLQKIEIPSDSKLVEIGSDAFYFTSIKKIWIPSKITRISVCTFHLCKKLQYVDISRDSQLKIIEEDAFAHTAITCFYFPPHLTQINENAFYECYKLQIIEIDEQSSITKNDLKYIYCKIIMIPNKLEKNFM